MAKKTQPGSTRRESYANPVISRSTSPSMASIFSSASNSPRRIASTLKIENQLLVVVPSRSRERLLLDNMSMSVHAHLHFCGARFFHRLAQAEAEEIGHPVGLAVIVQSGRFDWQARRQRLRAIFSQWHEIRVARRDGEMT